VKAYLDNNIVSAIATDDTPAQSEALDALLKVYDQGKIELVTSELTLDEIARYEGMHPARHGVGHRRQTWFNEAGRMTDGSEGAP
jgi:predicted nucleic acid-binding protein